MTTTETGVMKALWVWINYQPDSTVTKEWVLKELKSAIDRVEEMGEKGGKR